MSVEALPRTLIEIQTLLQPGLSLLPRFGAAFVILPLLRKTFVPRQVRIAFVIVLALVAYPHAQASFSVSDWEAGHWLVFMLKETFIGALVGYAMAIMLWAIAAVGDLMDLQAGFQNAQIFNPFGGQPGGPFGGLMMQIGVLMFVGYGGLHVFLQLLYESLVMWPPQSFTPEIGSATVRNFAIETSGSLLEIATRLAAPVIGVLLIIELGIGLINRAAKQINTFFFSMPIKAVTAAMVLALMLAHLVDVVRSDIGDSTHLLPKLDRVLQGK